MSGKLYLITIVLVVFGYSQAMDLKRLLQGEARKMRNRRALPNPSHNHEVDDRGEQGECNTENGGGRWFDGQCLLNCNTNTAGRRWFHGCHTCACPTAAHIRTATSTNPTCERRPCRSPIQKRDVSRFDRDRGVTPSCPNGRQAGESYRIGCNTCHCSAGGIEFCSVKNCELGVSYTRMSDSGEIIHEVADINAIKLTDILCRQQGLRDHKFTDGCHICHCSRHHGVMCSTNYCPMLPDIYWIRKFRAARRREQAIHSGRRHFDD